MEDECDDIEKLLWNARQIWLSTSPNNNNNLQKVEQLYRKALKIIIQKKKEHDDHKTKKNEDSENEESNNTIIPPSKKMKKITRNNKDDNIHNYYKIAIEKLSLLLCQSNRSIECKGLLSSLGYKCRLSTFVLDYPTRMMKTAGMNNNNKNKNNNVPCLIYDNFITDEELNILKSIFYKTDANYWSYHKYKVEPPSPYVSYLIPLRSINKFGFLGQLITKIRKHCSTKFPLLLSNNNKVQYVELWAHNRPHASGHQLHFDSDNEGIGGIRNPIISSIIYLTSDDVGGPSLITNQKLIHRRLATKGWVCHAKPKRLVAFDGKVLHGVIPGKGSNNNTNNSFPSESSKEQDYEQERHKQQQQHRVTIMLAFWKNIKERRGNNENKSGAAQKFPITLDDNDNDNAPEWAKQLLRNNNYNKDSSSSAENNLSTPPKIAYPIEIKPIYETLEGKPWENEEMGFPEYDEIYQGF